MENNTQKTHAMDTPKLDDDLANVLKETQNLVQNYLQTRKELKRVQTEAKFAKNQLEVARQRSDLNDHGPQSDWSRFSKSLGNVLKVVNSRKDLDEYERKVVQLSAENEALKVQMSALQSVHREELQREKATFHEQLDRDKAHYSKQISELTIQKELAASEASIKNDQLQSQLDRIVSERSGLQFKYEALLESLAEQKQHLREENAASQQREERLREQLSYLQNHSTSFLMANGPRTVPSTSQRYSQVGEKLPIVVPAGGVAESQHSADVVSSSSSRKISTIRSTNYDSSPQHPGSGAHIAKPRRKRKLFNQTADGC